MSRRCRTASTARCTREPAQASPEGKYVPAWRRDAKEKGELRTDNETSGEWAGDTYIAGSETEEKPKSKKVKAKEDVENTRLLQLAGVYK